MGILGAERRLPSPVQLSPTEPSLLARIAQHTGLPDVGIKRNWPTTSLKEHDPPMQRLLLRPGDREALSPAGMFERKAPLRLAAQKSGPHAPLAPMRSTPA
jgi:hypothetical protein